MFRHVCWPAAAALLLACALPLAAQTPAGAVVGTVRDQTGATVRNAIVRARNLETGAARVTPTDEQGRYQLLALAVGDYEIEVSHPGFRTAVQRPIRITVGRSAGVDLLLAVGGVHERVEVVRDAPLIDRGQSGVGGLVARHRMRDLPLNGRSVEQLALTQPGIVAYPHAASDLQFGAGLKFSAFGARPHSNLFLLDGTETNDQADFTPGSAAGVMLGVDTLREFRVLTHNYSAEFGRKAGSVVQAVTRSGSNAPQGSAFYFGRNAALDARNFFDLGRKPPFVRHQFGGTYGGPLRRDRTFLFAGYEELREDLGLSLVATVPDAQAHQGCLPTRGCFGVNPLVQPYLDLLPAPNGRVNSDGTGDFHSSPNRPTRARNMTLRVDQVLGRSGDSLFARYTRDAARVVVPDRIPRFGASLRSRYQYVSAEYQRVLSSSLLNVLRAGFNGSLSDTSPVQMHGPTPELAFVPGQQLVGALIVDSLTGNAFDQGYGPQTSLPRLFDYRLYELSNDLTLRRGRHLFKGGAIVKLNDLDVGENALNPRGSFNFTNLEAFLRGQPYLFRSEAPGSDTRRHWQQWIGGAYVQDDVRISSQLTVNSGIRFETVSMPSERDGKVSYLSSITADHLTPGRLWAVNPARALWAPRVGAAFRPRADGRLQITGAVGLYHDLPVSYFYSIAGSRTHPYHYVGSVSNPSFPSGLSGIFQPGARNLVAFDPVLRTPRQLQYHVTLQRELGAETLVTAGYVGSRGANLVRHQQANHRIPTVLPDGRRFYPQGAPVVNPAFSEIRLISTDAVSSYNGLQLGVDRRLARGWQVQASYVWSKSRDNNSGGWGVDIRNQESFVEDPYAPERDMGLSAFDARHVFTFNATARVPAARSALAPLLGGWDLSIVGRLSSGNPFTVVWASNRARTYPGSTRSRPDLQEGASSNPVLGTTNRYFDPGVFVAQPAGFTGNLGRNTLIGPGFAAVDLALVRSVRIHGTGRLQLRFEAFNLLNRANFAIPLRVVFDSAGNRIANAGEIKSTIAPARQLQLGAKFLF
jgi:hypothetical protein